MAAKMKRGQKGGRSLRFATSLTLLFLQGQVTHPLRTVGDQDTHSTGSLLLQKKMADLEA